LRIVRTTLRSDSASGAWRAWQRVRLRRRRVRRRSYARRKRRPEQLHERKPLSARTGADGQLIQRDLRRLAGQQERLQLVVLHAVPSEEEHAGCAVAQLQRKGRQRAVQRLQVARVSQQRGGVAQLGQARVHVARVVHRVLQRVAAAARTRACGAGGVHVGFSCCSRVAVLRRAAQRATPHKRAEQTVRRRAHPL
jgi:hypothetical protein